MQNFKGMTALVTGASGGIGAAAAIRLGAGGAHTLVHYHRSRQGAESVLRAIRAEGGSGTLLQADLIAPDGVERLKELVPAAVDILVNNAGSLIERASALDLSRELWDRVFMLNLNSAFFLTQALLPGMIARGRGVIVNVTSAAGRSGGRVGAAAYASAKAALSTLTKSLAREFAPKGIRVNAVSPGTIDTAYHQAFSTPEVLGQVAAATPMQRLGTAEEVAGVILFLCSEDAAFIQGQVIEVNGGFAMS